MIKVKLKVTVDIRAISKQGEDKRIDKPVNRRGKVPIATLMHIANTDITGQRGNDFISRSSQFNTAAGLDFGLNTG